MRKLTACTMFSWDLPASYSIDFVIVEFVNGSFSSQQSSSSNTRVEPALLFSHEGKSQIITFSYLDELSLRQWSNNGSSLHQ
jgi:hypothetical protein